MSFLEESAATPKGALAWITRCQVCLFFPLLLLEGLNLHAKSIRSPGSRTPVKGRWIELGMLAARFMIYFGLIFWLLPFGMAWASSECSWLSSASTWRDLFAESQRHTCLGNAR